MTSEADREIATIADELEAQLGSVPLLFESRYDAILSHHATVDDWCAKQVLGHLIEAEGEVFTLLIPGILGREIPAGWDQVPSMIREECTVDASALVARWKDLRVRGIALVRSLRGPDLTKTSERNWHGGETETVGALVRHWPHHTDDHSQQAQEAIRRAE